MGPSEWFAVFKGFGLLEGLALLKLFEFAVLAVVFFGSRSENYLRWLRLK